MDLFLRVFQVSGNTSPGPENAWVLCQESPSPLSFMVRSGVIGSSTECKQPGLTLGPLEDNTELTRRGSSTEMAHTASLASSRVFNLVGFVLSNEGEPSGVEPTLFCLSTVRV